MDRADEGEKAQGDRTEASVGPLSREENAEFTLPLPPETGGEFGQAAVYNVTVEYDAGADEWSIADDTFDTEQALYLANQDIWISHWGGEFYQGSGVSGQSDSPQNEVDPSSTTGSQTETANRTATAMQTETATETASQTETATQTATATTSTGSPQAVGDWLAETSNYEGSLNDVTDQGSATVQVGASGSGGNFAFAPPAIRVASGTTVTWEWTSEGGGHVVAEDGAFDSGEVQSGSGITFEHIFEGTGTFLYQCEPHGSLGMKGAVVIEG